MQGMFTLIKKAFSDWSEDNATRLAASLSYYTTFSLAPLLVLVISLLGLFGVQESARAQILNQVQDLAGEEGARLVENMIQTAMSPATGLTATIIGTVTLLFGALGVFGELQNSLNTIWEVKPKPRAGIFDTIKGLFLKRVMSFAMILVIGFLLLVSLVLTAGLASLGEFVGSILPISEFLLQIANFLVSFGVITLLFAMIFKFLPDAEISWKDVWLGAAITSLLFTIGKLLIGLYLGNSNIGTSFGAAGSLAILMIWVYYSAQIIFLGAEFTQVYANEYGSKIVPEENAVKVTEEDRAQQGIPREEQVREKAGGSGIPAYSGVRSFRMAAASQRAAPAGLGRTRTGLLNRALYISILASQFIPTLRSLYASKTKRA
jgi:membrane protein